MGTYLIVPPAILMLGIYLSVTSNQVIPGVSRIDSLVKEGLKDNDFISLLDESQDRT